MSGHLQGRGAVPAAVAGGRFEGDAVGRERRRVGWGEVRLSDCDVEEGERGGEEESRRRGYGYGLLY